jgi:hypothetical protein
VVLDQRMMICARDYMMYELDAVLSSNQIVSSNSPCRFRSFGANHGMIAARREEEWRSVRTGTVQSAPLTISSASRPFSTERAREFCYRGVPTSAALTSSLLQNTPTSISFTVVRYRVCLIP